MRRSISHFLREFFSYSSKERLGIFILLIILFIIILIPLFLSQKELDIAAISELKKTVDNFEAELQLLNDKKQSKINLFYFDPNTADSSDFYKLGFSKAQTTVIFNYRLKGGVFYSVNDFRKVYVVSDSMFSILKPYITIKKQTETKVKFKLIELNSADSVDLIKLKGIGSYYAKKIIERREKLGGFINKEQLLEIFGIDEERFMTFKDQIKVDTSLIIKININNVKAGVLRKHPYFDVQVIKDILKFRKLNGKIESIEQLLEQHIISVKQAKKMQPYIQF